MNDEDNKEGKIQNDSEGDVKIEADENLDDSVVAEESAAETIKKLRAKLKEAEQKAAEYLSGWQRAQADFINYKKRQELEKQEFLKYAAEGVLSDIIGALNDFEAAFNSEAWQKADNAWREGILRIYKRMHEALVKNAVSVINPLGQEFDPAQHLAVATAAVDSAEKDGKVLEVVNSGYLLNDKVIQPAKVKVGKYEDRS